MQAVDPEVVSALIGGTAKDVLVEQGHKSLVAWVGAIE